MIDIEVRGFQSIEHAHLKIEGFSALQGRSNIGKSALIRAIRCALTNPLGTSFVRHARDCSRLARKNGKTCKCQATVRIQTEGVDLLWEKGDAVNRYTFNGEKYDKPGPGALEFLDRAGFAKIGDLGTIQVSDQFFPLFLLDKSGPTIAETISDVSRLDRINAATRLAEKDRRETMASRKVREDDVRALSEQLEAYTGLGDALQAVRDVEMAFEAILEAQRRLDQVEGFVRNLDTLSNDFRRLQAAAKVDVPDPEVIEETFDKAHKCYEYHRTLDVLAMEVRRLFVTSKVDVNEPDELLGTFATVERLARFDTELDRRSQDVEKSLGVEADLKIFPDDDPLTVSMDQVVRLNAWMAQLRRHKETLVAHDKLAAEVDEVDPLESQVSQLRVGSRLITRFSVLAPVVRDLDAQETALAQEESNLESQIDALGICPTCARPLKEGHTHAQAVVSLSD